MGPERRAVLDLIDQALDNDSREGVENLIASIAPEELRARFVGLLIFGVRMAQAGAHQLGLDTRDFIVTLMGGDTFPLGEDPNVWYVICCRDCDDSSGGDPTPIPFATASERGWWATEHKNATGHDRWLVIDQPKGQPYEEVP